MTYQQPISNQYPAQYGVPQIYQQVPAPQVQYQQPYNNLHGEVQPLSMQPNIVTVGQQVKILSCSDIVCGCQAPQFEHCQPLCGFCVACFGSGLECCCCYGCSRADCCAVYCAGVGLNFLSFLIYGIVVSCIVGCKMMI
ncbi:Transmembrane_domain-containing protein [Hexamita inflata]|uniref:Transmembrane domain-containing protein n=1 Tax=Hexamita inflata TaxID=28002 RepID=A0AA86NV90_9EUKA|nr:Transmembrane domain-containing protein [Hexamita inflata]